MDPRRWLEALGRETAPEPEAVDRARARLAQTLDPSALRALLREIPAPPPEAAARVRARLEAPLAAPTRWRRRAAAAAGALLLAAWLLWPSPAPLDVALSAELPAPTTEGLQLDVSGDGQLQGTVEAPRVLWREGDLGLTSERPFELETREALVRGQRARLTLRRDPLGTHLSLLEGEATLRCHLDGDEQIVRSGGAASCLPVSAEGLLARARALHAGGAAPEALLPELERAERLADGPLLAELRAWRVELLARAGDPRALPQARDWLAQGHQLRREAILRIAAGLALRAEGCDGARPFLSELAADDPDAARLLETRCP